MAKTKQDWLKEAQALGLNVTPKDKIADLKAAIEKASSKKQPDTKVEAATDVAEADTTKAGKRSKKGQEEAEVKAVKESRKRHELDESETAEPKPKRGPTPKTKSRLERRGKNYQAAYKTIEPSKAYELGEAVKLAIDTSKTKFDATLELHLRLGVDPKQSDQNIRDVVSLPHGTGKTVRIAVFAPSDQHEAAKAAGADIVGEQDFLSQLDKNQLDFDVLISTPQVMSQLGKYAKLLGPKGLMPNPKSGTVTNNVAEAVKGAKGGRLEFRVDAQGIIHAGVGKVSFGQEKLVANVQAVVDAVKSAKPASVKSGYIVGAHLSTTMGPSVRLSL